MERSWLEKFYTECGREVTLAYTVLNQANNWGVTVALGFLTTIALSVIKTNDSGVITYQYPTLVHWYLVIAAWILLVRFFVRSALALANMYRWNTLIYAASRVLSVAEAHPAYPVYVRNCAKAADAYYYRFKSPVKQAKLVWRSLKLMYLWIFVTFFILFVWGVLTLDWDIYFLIGLAVFVVSLFLETIWFRRWFGLQYEPVNLEREPSVTEIWQSTTYENDDKGGKMLILGFCEDGPYKRAVELLAKEDLTWIPWSYHVASLSAEVASAVQDRQALRNARVGFASWPMTHVGRAKIIRYGAIDHVSSSGGSLRLTVNLDPPITEAERHEIEVVNPKTLCYYSGVLESKPSGTSAA